MNIPRKKGHLVIISSPSGGGKDSVINALLKIFPDSSRLITTTSRTPRPDQKGGIDYFFITPEEFKEKIKNSELVEHNFYAGNYYGVEKEKLNQALGKYELVFTQIEVSGKNSFDKAKIPHLSIFLLPENLEILKKRIEKRGGIEPNKIKERLKTAEKEIGKSDIYDYKLVNYEGRLDETIEKVAKIIKNYLKY